VHQGIALLCKYSGPVLSSSILSHGTLCSIIVIGAAKAKVACEPGRFLRAPLGGIGAIFYEARRLALEKEARYRRVVRRLKELMVASMDRTLEREEESGVRARAVKLLLALRTVEAMEIVYTRACKREVPPEDVDCPAGIQNGCRVYCCHKLFVRMTPEDVADGLEMHPGMPWFLRLTPGGCYALDPSTGCCSVWEKRPIACRLYNCYRSRVGPWNRQG
jgi:Fe-S-cluster containining protein